jgi:hypothetical protein
MPAGRIPFSVADWTVPALSDPRIWDRAMLKVCVRRSVRQSVGIDPGDGPLGLTVSPKCSFNDCVNQLVCLNSVSAQSVGCTLGAKWRLSIRSVERQ